MTYGSCIIANANALEPDVAYLAEDLYVPKPRLQVSRIQTLLQSYLPPSHSYEILCTEYKNHLRLPRHMLKINNLVDLRPRYQTVRFQSRIEWREPSQKKAFEAITKDGVINLAPGKGKTVIALHWIASRQVPAIVLVHTTDLLMQWKERAEKFLRIPGRIGLVYSKEQDWTAPLVIATVQSVLSRQIPKNIRRRFGSVVFDEVHHAASPTYVTIPSLFPGQRLGLTATAKRNDGLYYLIEWQFGPVLYRDLEQPLKPKIYFVLTGVRVPEKQLIRNGYMDYNALNDWLTTNKYRNNLAADLIKRALSRGRRIIVLTHRREHAKVMRDLVGKGGVCTGDVQSEIRQRVLAGDNPIFATIQLAKEGLDQPLLDTVFFLTPFKDEIALIQAMGRSQRIAEGKQDPVVVILSDSGSRINKFYNTLKQHIKNVGYDFSISTWKGGGR